MKQQTAVEWLEEQLFGSLGIELTEHQSKMANEIFFKQAKEMFESQIINAHTSGQLENDLLPNEKAQQYYKQTFKK
jgi:hypothetical protein